MRDNKLTLEQYVSGFNAKTTYQNRPSRIFYKLNGDQCTLYLASQAQMEYGNYQCELFKGTVAKSIEFMKGVMRLMCFEFGDC